jgi:hypothetical protein
MPCELSLEELAVRESDAEELRRLYSGWGFKHLLEALEETTRPKTEELFHEHADVR